MTKFNDALKKKKAEEEEKNKRRKIVPPIIIPVEEEKGKMDIFAFAKNPMIQMAAKAMPLKVKIIIALAVLMLLVGIGTTAYGIYLLLDMIPFVHNMPLTGSNIFYGIGFLYIFNNIFNLINIKSILSDTEKAIGEFDSTIGSMKGRIETGGIQEGKNIVTDFHKKINTRGKLSNIFGYVMSVWCIVGLFSSMYKYFITIILSGILKVTGQIMSKNKREKKNIAITDYLIKIGVTSYMLYNHFVLLQS